MIGRDVKETITHAMDFASQKNVRFVSPYADAAVASGNGTMIAESVQDIGEFDHVLVPIGGGGLVAGVGSWLQHNMPQCNVVGLQPAVFGRTFSHGTIAECLQGDTAPTLADGLAAQLHGSSALDAIVNSVCHVALASEEEIAKAIHMLLYNEGLLVEGAGAISVAALLNSQMSELDGDVLALITGGNIAENKLARVMATQIDNQEERSKLGLRAIVPPLDAKRRHHSSLLTAKSTDAPLLQSNEFSASTFWKDRLDSLRDRFQTSQQRDVAFRKYVDALGLLTDPIVMSAHQAVVQLADRLLAECEDAENPTVWQLEERTRFIVQLLAFLEISLNRASAAYDQSKRLWFYDIASQHSGDVNYARYGSHQLKSTEHALATMLGFDEPGQTVLLVSSGMAAYQLLESYLTHHVLKNGDVIARAPYIYFEADEQLSSFDCFPIVASSTYRPEDLVSTVESSNARVLFVDPIANIPGLNTVDLVELATCIGEKDWSERWLVIDGSLLSGGIQPFQIFDKPNHPKVLYYESGSKYVQFGMDIQMSGHCVIPESLESDVRRIRRDAGLTLYPPQVAQVVTVSRTDYIAWMRNLSDNAAYFAHLLDEALAACARVRFASEWRSLGWQHGGALVTIEFFEPGLNNLVGLEYLIESCLLRAKSKDIALIKGVSFGFSTTRFSASSAMAKNTDPFLRFSIGADSGDLHALADCVIEAARSYVADFGLSEGANDDR